MYQLKPFIIFELKKLDASLRWHDISWHDIPYMTGMKEW
jgi:hypothetical protein